RSLHHRTLPSFPTRRSSDLTAGRTARWWPPRPRILSITQTCEAPVIQANKGQVGLRRIQCFLCAGQRLSEGLARPQKRRLGVQRSEEHTSELQSRGHLVCRL